MSDLAAAGAAIDTASAVVVAGTKTLADASRDGERVSVDRLHEHQVLAYDLAHAAAAVEGSRVMLEYAQHGETESHLACAYIADAIHDVGSRVLGREQIWDAGTNPLGAA